MISILLSVILSIASVMCLNESKSKSKKTKSTKKTTIDVTDLEGEWDTVLYYNHTTSKTKQKPCKQQKNIKWSIKSTQFDQDTDMTEERTDLMFNSNGKFTIKQTIKMNNYKYLKIETMKDSVEGIEPCMAYKREKDKLYIVYNSTDPRNCPQIFYMFDGICLNSMDYVVSTCSSGKCKGGNSYKKQNAKKGLDSNRSELFYSSKVLLLIILSYLN